FKTSALVPLHGFVNAISHELPEVIIVLDSLQVVTRGSGMADEVRSRVQRDTLGAI
ncbi:ISL3 family transposase, partial [Pseudarthrobacter oxydans]|nr:ISL3 family transposase [Pseudarthrobacter oxydans]